MLNVSLIDWYPSFDFCQDVMSEILEQSLGTKFRLVDSHKMADVVFVGPYGVSHKLNPSFINSSAWKLYFTGENTVPDYRFVHHSLSFIRHDFSGRNFRLPLWWLHISYPNYRESTSFSRSESDEFLHTNLPLVKYRSCLSNRKSSVVAVFNHPDPLRLWTVQEIGKRMPIEKYGQCFGNGFEWGDHGYRKKIELISNFRFNYCPENSLHDGYFTEKILHARLAGCIPIVYADKYVNLDFNPRGIVNIYDFDSMAEFVDYCHRLLSNADEMERLVSEPVCTTMPDIASLVEFLRNSYSGFKNQTLLPCTDTVQPVVSAERLSYLRRFKRKVSKLLKSRM
jgi:hypothetical protein